METKVFNRKLTAGYLLLTFLIMAVCWGGCVLCGIAGITMDKHYWLYVPYLLGGWSPTIASYVILKKQGEVIGFKDWLKHIFDIKHSLSAYLITVLLAIVDFVPLMLISGFKQNMPLILLPLMIPFMLIGGGLEEAGWRYILFPELEKRFRFVPSAVITGVIWWLWHLPLFFIPGVSQYGQSFLGFGIGVMGMSFALGALRKHTGSVFLCVLLHCIHNALYGIYTVHETYVGSIITTVLLITVSVIWTAICERQSEKQSERKLKKFLRIVLASVWGIVTAVLLVVGTSRAVNWTTHRIRSAEGLDEDRYVTLGGMNQFIHVRSENPENPVILCLHGGPGSPDSYVDYDYVDMLDEEYTVVVWDQRGAGRTYEHNKKTDPENATLSFEQSLADLDALVDYLCGEFGQEQVIIMGHSYGTMLGGQYVYAHPEKVSHYIGIGQVVNLSNGERASYLDALAQAQAAGDDTSALESAWADFEKDQLNLDAMQAVRALTEEYHKAPKIYNEIWMGVSSPYMDISDMCYFFRLSNTESFMKLQKPLMDALTTDMADFSDFDVPVDIIMGEYDWTCPAICSEEYYELIHAPSKGFHVIEGCGHCPQFADAEAFAQTVREILRDHYAAK